MFRARKPSFKRSQLDETSRKRARVNSPAVNASPLVKATPVAKTPLSGVKKKGTVANTSTKSKAKTQSRIRFPRAKDRKPVGTVSGAQEPICDSKTEPLPHEDAKGQKADRGDASETLSVPVEDSADVACVAQALSSKSTLEESANSVQKPDALFVSRKRLDFGAESTRDDHTASVPNEPVETRDAQSGEISPVTNFWPPYEPADELLCRAHDHRLIKPEDDPILDAALELLL